MKWLEHSSSEMLNRYCHLHDEDSRKAMLTLAEDAGKKGDGRRDEASSEGNLRATGQSTIEKTPQVP